MDPFPGIYGDAELNEIFDNSDFYGDLSDYDDDDDDDDDDLAYNLHAGYNDLQHRNMVDLAIDDNHEQDQDLIDLTGLEDIPDVDVPPSEAHPMSEEDAAVLTEAECLQMILNVFPDIAINYALNLINSRNAHTSTKCQRLISNILDNEAYPKESDEINERKRKRSRCGSDSDGGIAKFEKGEHARGVGYRQHALNLLKDEFLDVPVRHIENVLNEKRTLFESYQTIDTQLRNYSRMSSPFSKVSRPRHRRGHEDTLASAGNDIPKELHAAKQKTEREATHRMKEREAQRAEEANLERAIKNGEMSECLCCFEDFPLNRMISCSGDTVHFVCKECARRYVEEEIGKARCRPICFADPGCGGTFTRKHLLQCLGERTFERLEHLQQQEDLRLAGLDFLEECPFCDYKAELPPIEIDKEFRCENPKCAKTSCRICQKETHIPMSCKEAAKDERLSVRHKVEEAKSEALIRRCNRCKNPFVKEHGCNKMTCTKCHNMQCYVCSKNVTNYEHFGNDKCPLHDNHEARHEEEVQKAEKEALAKIRADRPDISEEELKIEVSDRVKKQESDRIRRAQAHNDGFDFHMAGNELRRGRADAAIVPPPPAPLAPPAMYAPMADLFGRLIQMPFQQYNQHPQPQPPPPPPPPGDNDVMRRALNPFHGGFIPQQRIQYAYQNGALINPQPIPNNGVPNHRPAVYNAYEHEVQEFHRQHQHLQEEHRRLQELQHRNQMDMQQRVQAMQHRHDHQQIRARRRGEGI